MKFLTIAFSAILLLFGQVVAQTQSTGPTQLPTKAALPKRIRWSMPLCKEVNGSGGVVGTIDLSIARCDQIYADGQSIRSIEGQGLYVAAINGIYEGYYVADIFVANDRTDERVNVLSEKVAFVYWVKPNQSPVVDVGGVAPEKIAAKIKQHEGWRMFLRSLTAAMATQTARVNTSTSGTVSVVGNEGSATGVYSGTSTSTATVPNTELQRQTAIRNEQEMNKANERGDIFTSLALRSTTLFPGQQIRGAIFSEKRNFLVGLIAIEIAGTNFEFGVGPPAK